jgi:hypothetical protein
MNKVSKKEHNYDDATIEVVLGSFLFSASDFNGGNMVEKIVVLLGLVILLVGLVRLIIKYKNQNKILMLVLLSIFAIIASFTFIGLMLRLFSIF